MSIRNLFRIGLWLVAVGIFAYGAWHYWSELQREDASYQDRINTSLINFDVEWQSRSVDEAEAFGGGLGVHPSGIFLAAKAQSGPVAFLAADDLKIYPLAASLPDNNRRSIPETMPGGGRIAANLLRYNDLAILDRAEGEHLLVSYSYFHSEDQCFVSRLAAALLPEGWLASIKSGAESGLGPWEIVFETSPCLPLVDGAVYPFTGHQAGGRIAISQRGTVYVAVGDYAFDGLEGKLPVHPQIPDSSYGKIIELTPVDSGLWDQDVLAMGLRNPQGIAVDELGRVWETEHAAMGGDELNLIAPGGNYGWPEVSLGVNYTDEASDVKYWPFNPEQGRHPGYAMPAYAWLPSVAPSSADFVHGLTPRWEGDLLVGTLKLGSLLRLRIEGNRVLYAEQIPFVRRIRYAAVAHGRIYVLFDNGELAVLTPREPVTNYVDFSGIFARDGQLPNPVSRVVSGSALAANGCFECHSGSAAARLPGILGTDIASQPGVAYSQALRSKSGNWTEDNLRAFLTDPQSFASGTTMPDRQISPAHIDAVIEEIRSPGG